LDYVVFGIGFGATILVLGLLLRDLGPRIRYRRGSNGVLPADVLVAKVAWDRFCNALGAVLAIGGILFLLATFVCILLTLSNDTGGWVMLASLAVFFLMTLYWTWAFFDRFGAYGILPERPVAEEVVEPVPAPRQARQPERTAAPNGGEPAPARGATVVIGPTLEETAGGERAEPEATAGVEIAEARSEGDEQAAGAESGAGGEEGADTGTQREAAADEAVITPEERLARMEEPIDHGSAAGDLDTEPGVARPSAFAGRRAEPERAEASVEESGAGEEEAEASSEGQEPAREPDAEEAAEAGEPDDTQSR
jgi:hypothetical protein